MQEISKNFCMQEEDKISLQNAGDLTGLLEQYELPGYTVPTAHKSSYLKEKKMHSLSSKDKYHIWFWFMI